MSFDPTALVTALTTALAAPGSGTLIAGILHQQSASTGLNFKDKTITTSYYQNNPATATVLVSEGYTIVPG